MGPHDSPTNLVDRARELAVARPGARAFTWLDEGEGEATRLTFAQLDRAARAVASELRARELDGRRALLLYGPGLEFLVGFLGCLYAGVVAVPLALPRSAHGVAALSAIAGQAAPGVVLTDLETLPGLAGASPVLDGLPVVATDALSHSRADLWRPDPIDPASIAFLQYTSGSTGTPKGVQVTHANLIGNLRMIQTAFEHDDSTVIVGWLPLFHDMGLIGNALQALHCGVECVLMAPAAFVQRPLRWLRAISRHRATTSGSPNFGYELCVQKVRPRDLESLDLSSWRLAYNGSEPVRSETLEAFVRAFAPAGLRPEVMYPCYGLAEASLFVSGGRVSERPMVCDFDAADLARGRARPVAADPASPTDTRRLVGCGRAWLGERIEIVDPRTRGRLEDGRVGEIWVAGPNVAAGYRALPPGEPNPFGARLAGDGGRYLRTGDLGFVLEGQLFVAGRAKDVLIQRGRNHYPQDVEWVAGASHPALRAQHAAAFTVEPAPDEARVGERLVVAVEVGRRHAAGASGEALHTLRTELTRAVRQAVAHELGLQVWRVALTVPGGLPRTTSGKVKRRMARELWCRGGLRPLGTWTPRVTPTPQ